MIEHLGKSAVIEMVYFITKLFRRVGLPTAEERNGSAGAAGVNPKSERESLFHQKPPVQECFAATTVTSSFGATMHTLKISCDYANNNDKDGRAVKEQQQHATGGNDGSSYYKYI